MTIENGDKLRLPLWQLLALIVSIAVSAAGVGAYNINQFWELDQRWQARWSDTILTINATVARTGENLESKIESMPHQWFRDIVESNTRKTEQLKSTIRTLQDRVIRLESKIEGGPP